MYNLYNDSGNGISCIVTSSGETIFDPLHISNEFANHFYTSVNNICNSFNEPIYCYVGVNPICNQYNFKQVSFDDIYNHITSFKKVTHCLCSSKEI